MIVRRIAITDCKTMPWKNGGGSTTEIAIFPPDATIENFHWRLSSATVNRSGEFSLFPNCTRYLAIIEGPGLRLKIAEKEISLRPPNVLKFSGDDRTFCSVEKPPVRDLNLIFDRDRIDGELEVSIEDRQIRLPAGTYAVLALHGKIRIQTPELMELASMEAVLLKTQETEDFKLFSDENAYAFAKMKSKKV